MKYFSTFSGIGGFELGIIKAYELSKVANKSEDSTDIKSTAPQHWERPLCVGYSEIDKYATQVYSKHFPEHKNYGDITKINEKELPDFDLLVGGFPCQAFSIAGKRGGFEDTRGTLFYEVARILREKLPKLFLLENVKGLLSHDGGRTFKIIITALAELGYAVEWQVLNAKNFGVPQNRERVYIIGHLGGFGGREIFPLTRGDEEYPHKADKQGCANTLTRRSAGGGNRRGNYIHQLNNPKHSNERVYGTGGVAPTLNTMQGGMRQPFIAIPEATKKGYSEARVGDSINLAVPNSASSSCRIGHLIAQTLDTGMQQYTLEGATLRRLTPVECERLMGFPDQWTNGVSDSQRYKMCGNAVVTNVVQVIVENLMA